MASNLDINEIRNNINSIDSQLIDLLQQRKELCLKVGEFKYRNAKAVKDQAREDEHLNSLTKLALEKGLSAELISSVFKAIYKNSVALQISYIHALTNSLGNLNKPLKVAFLGNTGTYSYLATYKFFHAIKNNILEKNCSSFQEIMSSVENNEVDCAVVPIENTSSGCINEVYDLLQDVNVQIVGELTYNIEHCILATSKIELQNITEVYAHPQPLSQCSNWLSSHLPNAKLIPCSSSSEAMKIVQSKNLPNCVAIGCKEAGEIYSLIDIVTNIANQKNNVTRFIVISSHSIDVPLATLSKTSIIFTTENKPGSLVKVLNIFNQHNINMVKIQSRPRSPNDPNHDSIWAETFYVDLIANTNSDIMQTVIKELEKVTGKVKILGCYPAIEQNY